MPFELYTNLECVHEEELKVGSFAEHPEVGCQHKVVEDNMKNSAPDNITRPN